MKQDSWQAQSSAQGAGKRRAYVALEGGGAKGIAHVGALGPIQKKYNCMGFAGTSAGSIVAALAAAGLSASDIINRDEQKTILSRLDGVNTALDLFDFWSRLKLQAALGVVRFTQKIFPSQNLITATIFTLWAVASIIYFWLNPTAQSLYLFFAVFFAFILASFMIPLACLLGKGGIGLARLDKFEDNLRKILAKEILKDETQEVTFSDFGPVAGRPSLKMVATNLSTGKLQLFSPETTPRVPVAMAVAASICIPLVFAPRRMNIEGDGGAQGLFFDGGLVSNLPAWCFDDERRIDANAATIIVSVGDDDLSEPKGLLGWVRRLARTAIFGASELNHRGVGHGININLITNEIGTLDFDATFYEIRKIVDVNTEVTETQIDAEGLFDATTREAHEMFSSILLDDVGQHEASRSVECRIRVSIADVSDQVRRWRRLGVKPLANGQFAPTSTPETPIVFRSQFNFSGQTDRWLAIPPRSVCGRSILNIISNQFVPDLVVFTNQHGIKPGDFFRGEQDEMARVLASGDLEWILVLPISVEGVESNEAGKRFYLLALDGNTTSWKSQEEVLEKIERFYADIQDLVSLRFSAVREIGS